MPHLPSQPLLAFLILLPLIIRPARAFGFNWSKPTQCDNFTISWQGGTPPFQLLITPRFDVTRNISIPASAFNTASSSGSYSMALGLESQKIFLLTMSDATGFGTGGTSEFLTVGASISQASCNTSAPSTPFTFATPDSLQQCRNYEFTSYGGAIQPVTIWGLIPNGEAFALHPPSGPTSYTWKTNIAGGTTVVFSISDAQNRQGGTTDQMGVGLSDDSTCLDSNSPSSTTATTTPTSTSASSTHSSTTTGAPAPGHHSSNGGAIGGGIAGGVVALLLLLSLFFFWRKRRSSGSPGFADGAFGKKKGNGRIRQSINLLPERGENANYPLNAPAYGQHDNGSTANLPNDYEPIPYVLPPPPPPTAALSGGVSSYAGSDRGHDNESDLDPGARLRTYSQSTSAGLSKAAMASQERSNPSISPNAPTRFVLHTDAGSVMGDDDEDEDEEIVELPPQYNSLGHVIPQRRPSRNRSQRRPASPPPEDGSGTSNAGPSSSSGPPPAP